MTILKSKAALILLSLASIILTSFLALGFFEILLRRKAAARDAGELRPHSELGWDTNPPLTSLKNTGEKRAVYFIGDSFTHNAKWPRFAQAESRKRGVRFDGYTLGVPGFGTFQQYLKIEKEYERFRPAVVVLLFYAWNDMRDNFQYPAIYYNLNTIRRPYPPRASSDLIARRFLERLEIYPYLCRAEAYALKRLISLLGIDFFARHRLAVKVPYNMEASWRIFYDSQTKKGDYAEGAWEATEHAFSLMKTFLARRGARLIVLGIDNPLTVDADVYNAYIKKNSSVNIREPLESLGRILRKQGIPYVNCLPHLQKLGRASGIKVYNGPEGNLAGHLETPGERVIGRLAAKAIAAVLGR